MESWTVMESRYSSQDVTLPRASNRWHYHQTVWSANCTLQEKALKKKKTLVAVELKDQHRKACKVESRMSLVRDQVKP
jgi:hypothetical protein